MKSQQPLTVKEAAAVLGLSTHTIRSWVFHRKLGFVRLGRAIRIMPEEIERVICNGTVPARSKRGCQ
jgi:excisionase family DNA binding protein